MKTVLDGTLIGLGPVVAGSFPLRDQLGVLLVLVAAVVIAYFFWNRRP